MIPGGTSTGIGLRSQHHADVLAGCPDVGWVEVHAENFFATGGAAPRVLGRVRELWPLSVHGVGLSLGGTDPLSRTHLAALKRLVRDFEPALVSEHASWGSFDGVHYNDLLPLPYSEEALHNLAARVGAVQDHLGRRILVENLSTYLQFAASTMHEGEFLAALAAETGCGLLLDVNNIAVTAHNLRLDARDWLDLPGEAITQYHLAGHAANDADGETILIDDHGSRVSDGVWTLFADVVDRFGRRPTLVEWDTDLPALSVLLEEAARAASIGSHRAARAA